MPQRHAAPTHFALEESLNRAARAIPPLWPLSASVAVNPFLGQSGESLAEAGARLERVAGACLTMPRAWYREKIASGAITDRDLQAAWSAAPAALRPASPEILKSEAMKDPPAPRALPTVADLAAEISGIDWPGVMTDRIGYWLADYFDEGQALWAAPRDAGLYRAWKAMATHDLTPEIAGLSGFARHVADAPDHPAAALSRAVESLGLNPDALESFFHQGFLKLGGWAQLARYKHWRAEQHGAQDTIMAELLAIRAVWEEALFLSYRNRIARTWSNIAWHHAQPVAPGPDGMVDAILQEAWERASQRALGATLAQAPAPARIGRPALQVAFCIDVRSEVFRRALESLDPAIQTLGFAGFFGLAISHRRLASDVEERRLPVLLAPGFACRTGATDLADAAARIRARAWRALDRFKRAAVSSFAFVEASGPFYIVKLLADALGVTAPSPETEPAPVFDPAVDAIKRIELARSILRAMSLTGDFAPLVILMGHGAHVVNNPHAAGLHCGACGGHPGDVNPRLLAALLNDPDVRLGLAAEGIAIPDDTLFVAGLHDTTGDRAILYRDQAAPGHTAHIARAETWLAKAGEIARHERARRIPACRRPEDLRTRGRNWAQTRPEWGLAGCKAFIAAPRSHSAGKNLAGRAFLHDYDWRQDRDFKVLELILTAPVVVASWISLQYYGSTVAPDLFGAGNKLLHNVAGGVGVLEGNGGMLRAGLPWQSVHDGNRLVHEPLRLTVCIEAPAEAISEIMRRHPDVSALFDNRWLHLFTLDDQGRINSRYAGQLCWTEVQAEPAQRALDAA